MDLSVTEYSLIRNPSWTFVCMKDQDVFHSEKHGIAPIMQVLSENPELLRDAYVEDRVIGRAAALLLIYGQIRALYAELISEYAVEVLAKTKMEVRYERIVPSIMNRNKTGMCPMEETVLAVDNPEIAYGMLRKKMSGGA